MSTGIIAQKFLWREALRSILQNSGLDFTHEAGDITLLVTKIAKSQRLDLLICSIGQHDDQAALLQQIQALRLSIPQMKTIILADTLVNPAMIQAVQAGVEACLSNDISAQVLQRAVELVLAGQHLFPAELARHFVEPASPLPGRLSKPTPTPPSVETSPALPLNLPGVAPLSKREFQILRHLIEGLPNKTIARELDITEATVKVHIKALLRKTRMANRTQAAIWAMNNGFGLAEETQGAACPPAKPDGTPISVT